MGDGVEVLALALARDEMKNYSGACRGEVVTQAPGAGRWRLDGGAWTVWGRWMLGAWGRG